MSLSGEIITAFVAALGTIGTTVGLVAYLLRDLRAELRDDIGELRTELRDDIGELRTELRGEMQDLRTGLRSEFRDEMGGLRSEVRQVLVELLHHVQSGHHPPPQAA